MASVAERIGTYRKADYVGKFARMLRSSYMCSSVGINSINIVPVRTENFACKLRAASLVAEWIVAILLALKKGINISTMPNPATLTYRLEKPVAGDNPLDPGPEKFELDMIKAFGTEKESPEMYTYKWITYSRTVLESLGAEEAVDMLMKALTEYNVEELTNFAAMYMKGLFAGIAAMAVAKSSTFESEPDV